MSTVSQRLPEIMGQLRLPQLVDSNGDGIPDHIRLDVGNLHMPPAIDGDGDGVPDFLHHRPHHHPGEGEGEPATEGETEVQTATVPDVVGLTLDDAKTAIAGAGFALGPVGRVFSDTVPVDQVMVQKPDAGKTVPMNVPVALVVSAGPAPAPVAVPDVVGKTQADAESVITTSGFKVGMVGQFHSATVAQGLVIRQFPPAGTMALPGAPVNFILSLGPSTDGTPSV